MKKIVYLFSLMLLLILLVFIPNTTNATEVTVTNEEELSQVLGENAIAEGNKVTINGRNKR